MRGIQYIVGSGCAVLLACAPAGDHGPSTGNGPVGGIRATDQLTDAEQAAYRTDQQYIHGLVKPGVRVRFNLADARQYNFARTRLKLAGKTPANSPYLFELIEARRQQHLDARLKAGTFAQTIEPRSFNGGTADRQEMHYIEEASIVSSQELLGTAASTFPDGAYYTYVDAYITTVSGYPIGDFAYNEVFDNPDGNVGSNVIINTDGNPSLSSLKRYAVSSYKVEDSPEGFDDDYLYMELGAESPQSFIGIPQLSAPLVTAPVETIVDGKISVCMDRTWTWDCDYVLAGGGPQAIKMPLAGSIVVTSAHEFDRNAIQDIQFALINNLDPGRDVGSLKLILANAGGGCDVTDANTLEGKMSTFWSRVTLSPDNRTLSWDLTGNDSAFFDQGCRQIQDDAKLTARIALPLTDGTDEYNTSITITSDPDVVRPEARLTRIELTNSCLAEGTQVQLGDGKLVAVESLAIGQEVYNPYDRKDRALTITDTAKGTEHTPMVRIRDAAGRSLLMTEMHPIATPDRGMVQARALRAGDVVLTDKGPSELTEVSREPYSGHVYNLKLGSQVELQSLGTDQTVLHANGFVVGDGQIQSKYESLAMKPGARTIDQLPAQWRRDALLSPKRR